MSMCVTMLLVLLEVTQVVIIAGLREENLYTNLL